MNIAIFTDTFLPQINGVSTSIATTVKELGKKGHKVLLFAPSPQNPQNLHFKEENVQIIHLPSIPILIYPEFRLSILGLPMVLKHLYNFKPDIIHFHTQITTVVYAYIGSRVFGKPLVGTLHAFITSKEYLQFTKNETVVNLLNSLSLSCSRFFYNKCKLCFSPSKLLIAELYKHNFKRIFNYLPNPIDFNKFSNLSKTNINQIKKKYGLNKQVIGYVGRLSLEKNIDKLIDAFAILLSKNPNLSLLLVGDGPAATLLKTKVEKENIKNVVFTGFVEYEHLLSMGLLNTIDVFATASTMETQSMAVLEAMNASLPIVAVKQAGMTELVTDNGYLVDTPNPSKLSDKIETILNDNSIKEKMSKASKAKSLEFSKNKVIDKLLSHYQSVLN